MRHCDLTLMLLLLDDEVLVMLCTHDGALYEDTGHDVHHPEQDNRYEQEEAETVHPMDARHRHVGEVPGHTVGRGQEQCVECRRQVQVQFIESWDFLHVVLVPEIGSTLAEDDTEKVHHEEENQQGTEERPHGRQQRIHHFVELAHRPESANDADSACEAKEADRAKGTACRSKVHAKNSNQDVAHGRKYKDQVQPIPPEIPPAEELRAVGYDAEAKLCGEKDVERKVGRYMSVRLLWAGRHMLSLQSDEYRVQEDQEPCGRLKVNVGDEAFEPGPLRLARVDQ
mmetsp:Transcript_48726/g.128485  ORF Transcript_48726/g.128485 Transcript_48726/m.128485 type:complete len:284 (-) Transcript_48726:392-1243(-)